VEVGGRARHLNHRAGRSEHPRLALNEEVRQQMRRTEGRFRSAFDQAPIGMAIVTPAGRFLPSP